WSRPNFHEGGLNRTVHELILITKQLRQAWYCHGACCPSVSERVSRFTLHLAVGMIQKRQHSGQNNWVRGLHFPQRFNRNHNRVISFVVESRFQETQSKIGLSVDFPKS